MSQLILQALPLYQNQTKTLQENKTTDQYPLNTHKNPQQIIFSNIWNEYNTTKRIYPRKARLV